MKLLSFMSSFFHQIKQNRDMTSSDISLFFRQLSTLIASGISILKSCEILEKSSTKIAVRLLIYSIKREILSGQDLFSSLKMHSRYFDEITCHLVKIGEQTGKLETILCMIAENKEKNIMLKKRIQQALLYPCLIILTAFIVTFCLLYFVIPQFAELFANTQIKLPSFTRSIFYLSTCLKNPTLLFFLILLFISFIFLPNVYTKKIKQKLNQLILKLPWIHAIIFKVSLARFARNLSLTFSAGMPLTESLTLITQAGQPLEFSHLTFKLREFVTSGLELHQAMSSITIFPDLMIQMVKVGEESGMLEPLLNKIANFFEADIEHLVSQLNHLLEPLIMLVLGVLIGGLVIGMYLPIFKLGSAL